MALSDLRLPHFIIIGAMKSGTTTLYRYLDTHPEVDMSREKETDFFVFEKNWELGISWYSGQFSTGEKVRGEASPNYTKKRDFPGVPERMASICPDIRLIYVVRDPVQRALSQFKHSFILGTLNPDMEVFHGSHEYTHIMDASCYAAQLEAFLEVYSRESVLVIDFDELTRDPQSVMNRIYDYIGVSRLVINDSGAQNDSNQLARIPAPILRFVQSRLGQRVAALASRSARDKVRAALARGKKRHAPEVPDDLVALMRLELSDDAARFRKMTGMTFPGWSV